MFLFLTGNVATARHDADGNDADGKKSFLYMIGKLTFLDCTCKNTKKIKKILVFCLKSVIISIVNRAIDSNTHSFFYSRYIATERRYIMKRNEMTTNFSNYIETCLSNVGITPVSVDYNFETEKIAFFLFSDCKSEIYLNPLKDNKCRVSMWLATKYLKDYDGRGRQVNIKTTDISKAMDVLARFIEAHNNIDLRTDIEKTVATVA